MEMSQLSDLYPLMFGYLPGIDTFTLDQHLQQASREFCDKTESWREVIARSLIEGSVRYNITPSFDCRVKRIIEVRTKTQADIDAGNDGTTLDPHNYSFNPSTLTLTIDNAYKPSADVSAGLVVEVVLVPQITQTGANVISQDFLNVWSDGIMYRALFTLMTMPRQRWTNPDPLTGAPFYFSEYNRKVSDAMTEAALRNTTESDGWFG